MHLSDYSHALAKVRLLLKTAYHPMVDMSHALAFHSLDITQQAPASAVRHNTWFQARKLNSVRATYTCVRYRVFCCNVESCLDD